MFIGLQLQGVFTLFALAFKDRKNENWAIAGGVLNTAQKIAGHTAMNLALNWKALSCHFLYCCCQTLLVTLSTLLLL